MSKFLPMTSLAAAVAGLALTATPAAAQQVAPSDRNATATARIIKPLTLTWVQDLNLGDIMLSGAGAWTGAVVSITSGGVFNCSNLNVTCAGVNQVAKYNVTGTQGQTVTINAAPVVVMTNANDPTVTLGLTVDNPGSVTLANSGAPGSDFSLGGSITVDSTTLDGVYTGTFDVTVEY
jgi:hypothetical protein